MSSLAWICFFYGWESDLAPFHKLSPTLKSLITALQSESLKLGWITTTFGTITSVHGDPQRITLNANYLVRYVQLDPVRRDGRTWNSSWSNRACGNRVLGVIGLGMFLLPELTKRKRVDVAQEPLLPSGP